MSTTKNMPLNWYSSMKKKKATDNFLNRKFTLNVRYWHFLSVDFGVLVGLTMTRFCEEMLISNICIHGFMCSAIKKSLKVSNAYLPCHKSDWNHAENPKLCLKYSCYVIVNPNSTYVCMYVWGKFNLINIWQMFNLATDDLAVKPYIQQKSLLQLICYKCLAW